jgi:hypothetical protein
MFVTLILSVGSPVKAPLLSDSSLYAGTRIGGGTGQEEQIRSVYGGSNGSLQRRDVNCYK